MISEQEIQQAAQLLIDLYGDEAAIEVTRLADLMRERRDRDEHITLLRIKRALSGSVSRHSTR